MKKIKLFLVIAIFLLFSLIIGCNFIQNEPVDFRFVYFLDRFQDYSVKRTTNRS